MGLIGAGAVNTLRLFGEVGLGSVVCCVDPCQHFEVDGGVLCEQCAASYDRAIAIKVCDVDFPNSGGSGLGRGSELVGIQSG